MDNETSEAKEKQRRERQRCNHGVARKFISRGTVREQFVGATFDRPSKQKRDRCPRLCTVRTYVLRPCVCVRVCVCARVYLIRPLFYERRMILRQTMTSPWMYMRETVSSQRSSSRRDGNCNGFFPPSDRRALISPPSSFLLIRIARI